MIKYKLSVAMSLLAFAIIVVTSQQSKAQTENTLVSDILGLTSIELLVQQFSQDDDFSITEATITRAPAKSFIIRLPLSAVQGVATHCPSWFGEGTTKVKFEPAPGTNFTPGDQVEIFRQEGPGTRIPLGTATVNQSGSFCMNTVFPGGGRTFTVSYEVNGVSPGVVIGTFTTTP